MYCLFDCLINIQSIMSIVPPSASSSSPVSQMIPMGVPSVFGLPDVIPLSKKGKVCNNKDKCDHKKDCLYLHPGDLGYEEAAAKQAERFNISKTLQRLNDKLDAEQKRTDERFAAIEKRHEETANSIVSLRLTMDNGYDKLMKLFGESPKVKKLTDKKPTKIVDDTPSFEEFVRVHGEELHNNFAKEIGKETKNVESRDSTKIDNPMMPMMPKGEYTVTQDIHGIVQNAKFPQIPLEFFPECVSAVCETLKRRYSMKN